MTFHRRAGQCPRSLGVLPGSFNPPTLAHLELAKAARRHVDEVLFVAPSALPHKDYFGATLQQRVEMLGAMGTAESIASTGQGLFVDIARECREHYGAWVRLYFVCGRDAAERILAWDYGRPGVVEEMLRDFELLVARRGGSLEVPSEFRNRIHSLDIGEQDEVSSSEVRARIARGERWEHLVPEAIAGRVKEIYS